MTDFTLTEYEMFSEEELGEILRKEAGKMFSSESFENDLRGESIYSSSSIQNKNIIMGIFSPYWVRTKDFFYTNFHKIFLHFACFVPKIASRMRVHLFYRAS